MQLAERIVRVIIPVLIGIPGIILTSALLTVYLRRWRKITSPGVSDQITLTMALTSLLLQCSMVCNTFLFSFDIHTKVELRVLSLAFYLLFVLFNASFWNTAWLSIFYCVKLVNVSHRIFLWLKMKFSSSVTKLLVVSALGSVCVNLHFFWTVHMDFNKNISNTDELYNLKMEVNVLYNVFNLLISHTLPFTLTLICIGLSVASLLGHVWRIRRNTSQLGSSPQLQALVRAAVTMTLHVILDLTFLIIFNYMFLLSFIIGNIMGIICWLVIVSYPSIKSIVLIFGNPKLQSRLLRRGSTS